ncbi:hypothetical protein O3W44_03415 [Pantoea sp. LMR881]|uniref:hypothetical protein n=1 Tax=Pantoea sp. LMR881 TaxID=3014336 RepID=UPI0022B06667|nr:hypothetical protein [Pantoea sp. LMR881]MCZ4058339.1 hypothetical protein [Pantoea sp. LMR881]
MNHQTVMSCCASCALLMLPAMGLADDANLAKKLSNPVSDLISVPFQYNYDENVGAGKGSRNLLNIQPVIPFSISEDANIVSRTILPVISQHDVTQSGSSQNGIGDVTQSFFYSPKKPTDSGLIWGVGTVLLLPTGSDSLLSGRKWGAGPTAVGLKQSGPWTYGMLANHIWDYAGDKNRPSVNVTYLQPFLTYTTASATTVALNLESTYDWREDQWSVPANLMVNQIMKIGEQTVQVGGGVRYWLEHDDDRGPHGWGLRLNFTLLLPR